MDRPRVLFVSAGNAVRSQMAEGILAALTHGRIDVQSAGAEPAPAVHPMAVSTMRERHGLDLSQRRPKGLDAYAGQHFDYVFTLCDRAGEQCADFPGDTARVHWNFPNPADVDGDDADRHHAFAATASELATRLGLWLALPPIRQRVEAGASDAGT